MSILQVWINKNRPNIVDAFGILCSAYDRNKSDHIYTNIFLQVVSLFGENTSCCLLINQERFARFKIQYINKIECSIRDEIENMVCYLEGKIITPKIVRLTSKQNIIIIPLRSKGNTISEGFIVIIGNLLKLKLLKYIIHSSSLREYVNILASLMMLVREGLRTVEDDICRNKITGLWNEDMLEFSLNQYMNASIIDCCYLIVINIERELFILRKYGYSTWRKIVVNCAELIKVNQSHLYSIFHIFRDKFVIQYEGSEQEAIKVAETIKKDIHDFAFLDDEKNEISYFNVSLTTKIIPLKELRNSRNENVIDVLYKNYILNGE